MAKQIAPAPAGKVKNAHPQRLGRRKEIHWQLWLMMVPAIVYMLLFVYKPMGGVLIAFQDYSLKKGIWGSQWIGFENFNRLFRSYWFPIILKNTLTISLLSLILSFPAPIILALAANEIRSERRKRTFQTVSYAPHFISTVVVCGMITVFLSPESGVINFLLKAVGGEAYAFLAKPAAFKWVYVISGIWQTIGWSAIIYIAALSGVDKNLLEADEYKHYLVKSINGVAAANWAGQANACAHSYAFGWTQAANCTQPGGDFYKCSACGAIEIRNKVEATGNEQIFGMLTWYGKRGFDTSKNNDCYGYMVLMTDGSNYDGASVPFWNDSYSSAFIVEETEYIAEPLNVVAVTPAEDEVVNSLREITIEFDAEIAVKELSGTERISIQYLGISNILIGTTATVEGNTLKLVTDTEIKDSGKHTLVIPADVVTRVSDGVAYEGGTFTFTVEKAAVVVEPLTVVAVTPAESVEKLETITIEFSDKVDVPATASGKFTIADADGNNVATLYAWDAAVDGKVVTLTLTEAITEAGEYTFSFAEGLVTRQGDGATCAYTCTINVTGAVGIDSIYGEAGDCVIYDITGRKIEKITEGGIYIVNGKKVLVK